MSTPMIVAGGFAFLAVALCVAVGGRLLSDRLSGDRRKVLSRLRALADGPAEPAPLMAEKADWAVAAKIGEWASTRRRDPLAKLRDELALAGYASPSAAVYYVAVRLGLLLGLAACGGLVAGFLLKAKLLSVVLWATVGGLVGYILPSMHLTGRVKQRQASVRAGLPDVLDVMVMCVESGASVAAAVDCVADEFPAVHPLLGEQLALVRHEMQLGATAGQAFGSFADRCGVLEVRDLAGILSQSEQYGTSVGKALRTHSESARVERQLWCEGMAAKAAVKIMFPTLLCIFPAMFIVLLGPAAFQMSKMFSR